MLKKYIHAYSIILSGMMEVWQDMKVLIEKAHEGVEVRVFV